VEALVNTVNTIGVMGKGLALQFKRRFPENFRDYAAACSRGEVAIGRMFVTEMTSSTGPRYLINFPTKKHWFAPSQLEYVRSGLIALVGEIRVRGIRSIAVPPLGCGNGGLAWTDVRPIIEHAMAKLPEVCFSLFAPSEIRSSTQLYMKLIDA
jgi:O-acetyl-ADP-ribose deacetylase (regulator of RNase III)